MIETIIKATVSFCEHQLAKICTQDKSQCLQSLFIAEMDILDANSKVQISIGITQSMLQNINMIFLDEADSSKEELTNMLLEVTNMIVGSAKVLMQSKQGGERFISVPRFKKYGLLSYKDANGITLRADCGCMVICAKDIYE